jgi:hypothetical protein
MVLNETTNETIFQVCSGVATIASLLVVLTGLFFPSMVKNSFMMNLICSICLCNFFSTSVFFLFGYPEAFSTSCVIQGAVGTFFFPASWIFTSFMCYQLRCLLIDKRVWISLKWIHFITWSITSLVTFVPLLYDVEFGEDDKFSKESPCNIETDNDNVSIYDFFDTWFSILVICFILMFYWSIEVASYFKREGINNTYRMYTIYTSIILYPLGLIIVWLPVLILTIIGNISNKTLLSLPAELLNFCQFLSTQYGTFVAITFFRNSHRARSNWKYLLSFTTQNDHEDIFEDNYIDDNSFNSIVNSMASSSFSSNNSSTLMFPLVSNTANKIHGGALGTNYFGYGSDMESIARNLTGMKSSTNLRQNSSSQNRYIYIYL